MEKKEREDIVGYIEKYDINSEQLEIAYELAMGVPEDKDALALSEQVRALAKMIDEHTASGFPLTEIRKLVDIYKKMDEKKGDLKKWITQLEITENEKNLLVSVVEERRIGTIMFEDARSGNDIFRFDIPNDAKETSSTPVWAHNFERLLKDAIARSTRAKIRIWFAAKS